jgi:xanthine dehydrogenase accessory factor
MTVKRMALRVLVRGGGDLASGAILRMRRAGWQVLVAELPRPLAVRRYVSFAQAVYDGQIQIEDIKACRVDSLDSAQTVLAEGCVPIIVDPDLNMVDGFRAHVIVDGRMTKRAPETSLTTAPLVIGLGPGFTAGVDCHAVIETNRGAYLGRVIWQGQAQADTGVPEMVGEYRGERVLRAPVTGTLRASAAIGDKLAAGDRVASVDEAVVTAPFDGVLRGLLMDGQNVQAGDKIGDVDPRGDPRLCWLVSDKALSVGGGVLEAILVWEGFRGSLCEGGRE